MVIPAGCPKPLIIITSSTPSTSPSRLSAHSTPTHPPNTSVSTFRTTTRPLLIPTIYASRSDTLLSLQVRLRMVTGNTSKKISSGGSIPSFGKTFTYTETLDGVSRASATTSSFSNSSIIELSSILTLTSTTAITHTNTSTYTITTTPAATTAVPPAFPAQIGLPNNRTGVTNGTQITAHILTNRPSTQPANFIVSGTPSATAATPVSANDSLLNTEETSSSAPVVGIQPTTPTYWFIPQIPPTSSTLSTTLVPTISPSTTIAPPPPLPTSASSISGGGRAPAMLSTEIVLGCVGFIMVVCLVKWGIGKV